MLDIGTYQVKAGYAGEDAPKFSCPTSLGVEGSGKASKDAMDIDGRQFKTGWGALETATEGMEVVSPFKDGLLDDWDAVTALCDHMLKYVLFVFGWLVGYLVGSLVGDSLVGDSLVHSFARWLFSLSSLCFLVSSSYCIVGAKVVRSLVLLMPTPPPVLPRRHQMRLATEEHPMMLAEPSHNTNSVRENMVELMFETYNVPAVFLAKNAVLSSFAMGRQTSLVVDMGHEATVGT